VLLLFPLRKFLPALAGILCFLPGSALHAVQVYGTSGTDSTYTTAPAPNDFGFANVGRVYDTMDGFYTSGVYLGNGWMLSAYHEVRNSGKNGFLFGNVVLNGTAYGVNASTAVRLSDPSTHAPVDLAMYQLTVMPVDPNLKTLVVATSNPSTNASLTLMGNGINRADSLTYWDSNWTVQTGGTGAYSGYLYGSSQSMRWGNGAVAGILSGDDGYGVTSLISSVFQGTTGSAMAAGGDSGGGVFHKKGSTWNLAGIMLTVGTYSGQPANTSVVGNATYAANLAYYSSQIASVSAPSAPSFTSQPSGLTIVETQSATFSVAANGTPPPGCQWQRMPAGSGTWSNLTDISGVYSGAATASLTVSNATLSMNGDQFRCIAANGILPNATSNAVTLGVQPGYNAWALGYFGSLSNPSVSGPSATPQNDGIANAIKYLADIDPTIPMTAASYAALPAGGLVTISGTQYLTLTYRRNKNIPGLTLTVQTSTDLQTWQTVTPDATQQTGTDSATGDPIIQIQVKTNGGPKMFLRLSVAVSS
jgi:hypothetical protein